MPRIRQLAEQYKEADRAKAEENFRLEIKRKGFENDLETDAKIARALKSNAKTVGNHRRAPETMKLGDIRDLVELLKPDIKTVLLFIGYSEKDIRTFARENST